MCSRAGARPAGCLFCQPRVQLQAALQPVCQLPCGHGQAPAGVPTRGDLCVPLGHALHDAPLLVVPPRSGGGRGAAPRQHRAPAKGGEAGVLRPRPFRGCGGAGQAGPKGRQYRVVLGGGGDVDLVVQRVPAAGGSSSRGAAQRSLDGGGARACPAPRGGRRALTPAQGQACRRRCPAALLPWKCAHRCSRSMRARRCWASQSTSTVGTGPAGEARRGLQQAGAHAAASTPACTTACVCWRRAHGVPPSKAAGNRAGRRQTGTCSCCTHPPQRAGTCRAGSGPAEGGRRCACGGVHVWDKRACRPDAGRCRACEALKHAGVSCTAMRDARGSPCIAHPACGVSMQA